MSDSQRSIFSSLLRGFLNAFFSLIGTLIAVIVIIFLITFIAQSSMNKSISGATPIVLPNAKNVRGEFSYDLPLVLVVDVKGFIGGEEFSADLIEDQLLSSREGALKDRVKAVLLKVNSGGGAVFDSDKIYRALVDYKERYNVPIYAYVDGLCASGALYICSSADKIYASEISEIGSVGVLAPFLNFSDAMEKIGIQSLVLTAGKDKDLLNSLRPWREGEAELMQKKINVVYDRFVDIVVRARPKITRKELVNVYGAQVFPAEEAKEKGFVDFVGLSRNDALLQLLQSIGIEDDNYQVVRLDNRKGFRRFLQSSVSLFRGKVTHQVDIAPGVDLKRVNQILYLYE